MTSITTQIVPALEPEQDRDYFRLCMMEIDPSILAVDISQDGTSVTTTHASE